MQEATTKAAANAQLLERISKQKQQGHAGESTSGLESATPAGSEQQQQQLDMFSKQLQELQTVKGQVKELQQTMQQRDAELAALRADKQGMKTEHDGLKSQYSLVR